MMGDAIYGLRFDAIYDGIRILDDGLLKVGTDSDGVLLQRSATLGANTALTSVFVGTPVTPALPANSVILSNITASGDILLATNKGGNSIAGLWLDGSAGDAALMASSSASVDHYIAGTKVLDHSAGAFAFQEDTTISSTGTLTINAFTAGGDITIGANKVKTTDLLIKQVDATSIGIRNVADSAYLQLRMSSLVLETGDGIQTNASYNIDSWNSDGGIITIRARDSAVGIVNVARVIGSADPYVEIGRDDTGVALNAVTDGLVLQMGGGTGNEAAGFGFGLSVKLGNAASQVEERGSLDWVLVTATDASEDSRLDFNLMAGGAMNLAAQLSGAGVLDVDLSSGLGAATVGLFDDYDDAIVLRQGISERKLDVLEKIGVIRRKNTGSGWMLNVQAMLYLLAGGVYQNRQMMDDRLGQLEHRLALKGV